MSTSQKQFMSIIQLFYLKITEKQTLARANPLTWMYPADTECTGPASGITHTSNLSRSFPNISSAKPALLNL